jgi:hypothetical protein
LREPPLVVRVLFVSGVRLELETCRQQVAQRSDGRCGEFVTAVVLIPEPRVTMRPEHMSCKATPHNRMKYLGKHFPEILPHPLFLSR